mmetsp:Transcript_19564/g.30175  ORF Transcript_19564/g.30175 Transcript_19564/m.30175 type:complete len:237 (+) Transcript_19564:24-734(+)
MMLDESDYETIDLASPCLSKDPSTQGIDLELDAEDGSVFVFDNKAHTLFSIVNDDSISIASASIVSMSNASIATESSKTASRMVPPANTRRRNVFWRVKDKMKKMKCVREDEEELDGQYPTTSKKKNFKLPLLGFPLSSKRTAQMDQSHSTVDTISASETTYAANNLWSASSKEKPLSMSDTMYHSTVGHRTTFYTIGRTSSSTSELPTTFENLNEEEKCFEYSNEEEKCENTLSL